MPVTNKTQPRTPTALTRAQIEKIATDVATKVAREVVQQMLGDEQPAQSLADALAFTHIPEPPVEPEPVVVRPIVVQYTTPDERRFVACIPTNDGIERQAGTRNMATGQVVLDGNNGAFLSWVAFLNALHAQGRTPTKIEWDDEAEAK
jgi:hypothetical protein